MSKQILKSRLHFTRMPTPRTGKELFGRPKSMKSGIIIFALKIALVTLRWCWQAIADSHTPASGRSEMVKIDENQWLSFLL